jgi:hypothetical protein
MPYHFRIAFMNEQRLLGMRAGPPNGGFVEFFRYLCAKFNMEEPADGIRWSMEDTASVWFWRASAAGAVAFVAGGSAWFRVDRSLARRPLGRSYDPPPCAVAKVVRGALSARVHGADHAGSWRPLPDADVWFRWRWGCRQEARAKGHEGCWSIASRKTRRLCAMPCPPA